MNIDTLTAIGFIRELADKTKHGSVAFSQSKDESEVWEKIVYDDRKPEEDDERDYTAYPVIYCYDKNYFAGKDQRIVAVPYDALLQGLKVRYCVFEHTERNFVKFSARDEDGRSLDYIREPLKTHFCPNFSLG